MTLRNTIVFTLLVLLINSNGISAQDDFDLYNIHLHKKELSNISGPDNSICEIRFFENRANVSILFDKSSNKQSTTFNVDYKWNDSVFVLYHPLNLKSELIDWTLSKRNELSKVLDFEHWISSNYGIEYPAFYRVSFDGINLHELDKTSISYENIKFDSVFVNGYWIPISSDTLSGSYDITIETIETYEEFISEMCSINFDSLVYAFDGKSWQIESGELTPCIAKYMNNLVEKNWYRYANNYSINYNTNTHLPNSYVTSIQIDSTFNKVLDFSHYPSLKSLDINTNQNKLKIKLPHDNLNLKIQTLDSLSPFKLKVNDVKIKSLSINTPKVEISSGTIHALSLSQYSISDLKHLKNIPSVKHLSLNYHYNPDLTKLDIRQDIKSLLISADTIHIDCDSKLPKSLDSLVLYGYSDSFGFLNCSHNLSYLGIYYLNSDDKPVLDQKFPELKKELWCFPDYATVATPKGEKIISDIVVGDTVICLNENGEISQTIVTQVEFHYNCNTALIQLNDRLEYATINQNQIESSTFSAQFVPNHPLYVDGLVKKAFVELNNDDKLVTLSNERVQRHYIESRHISYSGTLINLSTKEGNYFINGICFSNK